MSVKYSEVLDRFVVMTTHGVETRNPQTGALVETVTEFGAPIGYRFWGDISPDGMRWALAYNIYAEGTFLPTATRLMVGSMETGQILVDRELSFIGANNLYFSSDSASLYVGADAWSLGITGAEVDDAAIIAVIRVSDGELIGDFSPNIFRLRHFELSPQRDKLLVVGSSDYNDPDRPTIALIDLVSTQISYPPLVSPYTPAVAFSADGLRIHSGNSVWDSTDDSVSSDGLTTAVDENCNALLDLEFSEDGSLLSKLWYQRYLGRLVAETYDLASGEIVSSFESGWVSGTFIDSLSGAPKYFSSFSHRLQVVDPFTGQEVWELRNSYNALGSTTYGFSSDGRLLARCIADYLDVLDLQTDTSRRMFLESSSTRGVAFADATTLIVSQPDGSAEFRMADPASAQFGAVLRAEQPMTHQATEMKIFRVGIGASGAAYALSVTRGQSTCESGSITSIPAESVLWDLSDGSVIWRADRDLLRDLSRVEASVDGEWLRIGAEVFPLSLAPSEETGPALAVRNDTRLGGDQRSLHFDLQGIPTDYTEHLRRLTELLSTPGHFDDQLEYDSTRLVHHKSLLIVPFVNDVAESSGHGLYFLNSDNGDLLRRHVVGSGSSLGPNGDYFRIGSSVYAIEDLLQ